MFITLEGVEGSGKSTQAARLTTRLRAAGRRARQTREPGGTPLADAIRALLLHPDASIAALGGAGLVLSASAMADGPEAVMPETELFLLSAARAQHVAQIRAWLAVGEVVISDRFADATRAYQGYGRAVALAAIGVIEEIATGGLHPDLTLLFDLPVAEGQRRKRDAHTAGGEWNRLDAEAIGFHERVRAGYLALAATAPERWIVLDATQPVDELEAAVWSAVAPRLTRA